MHTPLSIALAQLNPHLGNVRGNLDRLVAARAKAAENGAVIIVTPEMYLAGYPCDDLVLRSDFMDEMTAAIDELTALTEDGGPAIIVGAPHAEGGVIYNSVFVLDGGTLLSRRDKVNLPNTAFLMTNGILSLARCLAPLWSVAAAAFQSARIYGPLM